MPASFTTKCAGSPWPTGFVPMVDDPHRELIVYLEWLETMPLGLQEFVDNLPKSEQSELKQLGVAGITEYQKLRCGWMPVRHEDAMRKLLYTVTL